MRYLSIVVLLLGWVSAALAGAPLLEDLRQDNALLQAEYALARDGRPYLLIDLPERRLQLKASGLSLVSWEIDGYRCWGHPAALPAAKLEHKSSLDNSEREVLVVNAAEPEGKTAGKPFKALELADMPTVYRLRLANGTVISVRPTPARWDQHLRRALAVPAWYLSRPLISNWNFLRGRPYNEVALGLSEQDARKLYWASIEGTPCLIRLRAAVVATAPAAAGTKR
jgi:hypothetical protein